MPVTSLHAACVLVIISLGGCSDGPTIPTTSSLPATMTIYEGDAVGLSYPTVIRNVPPSYTAAAIANRIQGVVLLTAVVLPNGTVGEVVVVQSLDTRFGLDEQAVQAAKQWLFNPGVIDGRAVAVRVRIEMSFMLSSERPFTN